MTKRIKVVKAEMKKVEEHASRHRAKAKFLANMLADMSPSAPGHKFCQLPIPRVPSFPTEPVTQAGSATPSNSTSLSVKQASDSGVSASPATAEAASKGDQPHQMVTTLPGQVARGADLSQPVGQLSVAQDASAASAAQTNEAFSRMAIDVEDLKQNRRKQFAAVSMPGSLT